VAGHRQEFEAPLPVLNIHFRYIESQQAAIVVNKMTNRHGTSEVKSMIREVLYKLDINTLHREETDTNVGMNDIVRIRLRTASHLLVSEIEERLKNGPVCKIHGTSL